MKNHMGLGLLIGVALMLLIVGAARGLTSLQRPSVGSCIQIFHDRGDTQFSKSLKAFLNSVISLPIGLYLVDRYVAGDFEKCQFNFYVGSLYDGKLPRTFLDDYFRTEQKVVWMGYNIWQLGDLLEKNMGLRFLRMAPNEHSWGVTTASFRDILYNGQVFSRLGSGAQVELVPTDFHKFEALAEVRHTRTREVIPYIVRAKNRIYIADKPLVDLQNKDASFVWTHVLVEILGLQHLSRPQYGFR